MRWFIANLTICITLGLGFLASPSDAANLDEKAKFQLAQKYIHDWQIEDALSLTQELLFRYPDEPAITLLAAQIQLERGHYRSALSMVEFASGSNENASYIESVIRSSGGYAEYFQSLQTAHFKISYVGKDEIVAHYASQVLESAYARIGKELGFLPAEREHKIVVEIYPTARGLAGATGLTISEIETSGTIAVCKFNKLMIISPLATANGYSWADTLAHEFIHLVISKISRNSIPIWLHEGIAKFYESLWNGPPGRALKPYSQKLLAQAIKKNEWITFEQMHPSMAKLPSQEAAGLAFAEVFTVIEFLRKTYGKSTIPKLLRLAGSGVQLEKAFVKIYGLNFKQLEATWRRYVRKRPLRTFAGAKPERIQLSTHESTSETQKPLESIEDPQIQNFSRLGELLQLRNFHKAAILQYEKAYKKSKNRYPTLVNRLARAYISTKSYQKAQTVLDGLLQVHPDDSDARLAMGRLQMESKQFTKAMRNFEALRLRNPFNPEIHHALESLYNQANRIELAKKERHFLELSRKPRTQRQFPKLVLENSSSSATFIGETWAPILVNGELEINTPFYGYAIEPGTHRVEYTTALGKTATKEFTVYKDQHSMVILK